MLKLIMRNKTREYQGSNGLGTSSDSWKTKVTIMSRNRVPQVDGQFFRSKGIEDGYGDSVFIDHYRAEQNGYDGAF